MYVRMKSPAAGPGVGYDASCASDLVRDGLMGAIMQSTDGAAARLQVLGTDRLGLILFPE